MWTHSNKSHFEIFKFDGLLQKQAGGHFFFFFLWGYFIHQATVVCILWLKSNKSTRSFPKTNEVSLRCKWNHNTFLKLLFTTSNLQETLETLLHYRAHDVVGQHLFHHDGQQQPVCCIHPCTTSINIISGWYSEAKTRMRLLHHTTKSWGLNPYCASNITSQWVSSNLITGHQYPGTPRDTQGKWTVLI